MSHYDRRRERQIETPVGDVMIVEKMWDEGESSEHWAHVLETQCDVCDADARGEVLAQFVEGFAIAKQLFSEGYEVHSRLDETSILLVNYT